MDLDLSNTVDMQTIHPFGIPFKTNLNYSPACYWNLLWLGKLLRGKRLSSYVISSPVFPDILTCSLCVDTEFSLLALAVWIEHCVTSLVLYILASAGILGCLSNWSSHEDNFR